MITYYTKEGRFNNRNYYEIPISELHRKNKPALIEITKKVKYEAYYINGKLHRLDGPAAIQTFYFNNKSSTEKIIDYWVNDKQLNTNEVEAWIKDNNIDLKTKAGQIMFTVKFFK